MISSASSRLLVVVREASVFGKGGLVVVCHRVVWQPEVRRMVWQPARIKCTGCHKIASATRMDYFMCRLHQYLDFLNPWFILHKLGVPRGPVIKFRRLMIRYSYPWITYCIPTACVLIIGDILAQTLQNYVNNKNAPPDKVSYNYDFWSTLRYGLIGFFIVGPILSKWDLVTYRMLQCQKRYRFFMTKILLDVLLLSPLLLALVMLTYDYRFASENVQEPKKLKCKYKKPFTEIMTTNVETRPLAMLLLLGVLPFAIRRKFRGLYEILFFTYVSKVLRCAHLGKNSAEMEKIREEKKKQMQQEQRLEKGSHNSFCSTIKKILLCTCLVKSDKKDK